MSLSEFLTKHDSFWKWNGHKHVAKLSGGKLSDFYANCTPVFADPKAQREFAVDLVECARTAINEFAGDRENVWVIGSAMGAVGLAQAVAASCSGFKAAFTEPVDGKMDLKRFDLGHNPQVILVEDVVTSGGTTVRTIDGIREKHPDARFFPLVLALVNRKPGVVVHQSERLEVRALYEQAAKAWVEGEGPEEMNDCVPLRPKGNWEALTTEKL